MRNPWEFENSPWTSESSYFNWMRSQTRRIWSRHPVKIEYKKSRRYKAPVGIKGKEVWVSDCEICGCQSRTCEVDHITAGGSFKDWDTFTEWLKRILWVSVDDIRELCHDCHGVITLCQRYGYTWEEGVARKAFVAKVKQKAEVQKKELKLFGYKGKDVDNQDKRDSLYMKLLEEGKL